MFNYSDTARHRTTSDDVVRCRAQCEHRFRRSDDERCVEIVNVVEKLALAELRLIVKFEASDE